jgi:hypothetical protein
MERINKIFTIFDTHPEIFTAFSTRFDGSMRVGSTGNGAMDAEIKNNRRNFLKQFGIINDVAKTTLVHGSKVFTATNENIKDDIEQTDALITNQQELFLSLTVSDCLPVYFYDPVGKAVGLTHVGWRGLENEILKNTVVKMAEEYGTSPRDLLVGVGPCICEEHYQIQEDLVEKFQGYPQAIIRKDNGIFLDLTKIAEIQLQSLGVAQNNIEISKDCTYGMPEKYFSYRRDKPELIEPMIAVIGMKK